MARSLRGLRLDPGYLYSEAYAGLARDPAALARHVASLAADAGFTALFALAYSPRYGAYYRTSHPAATVEPALGAADFLPALTRAARERGLDTIAWLPLEIPPPSIESLVEDLLARVPGLFGVDAAEAAAGWRGLEPGAVTRRYASIARIAHAAGAKALVTEPWAAAPDGSLLTQDAVRSGSGLDLEAILSLPAPERPDYFVGELSFQQWRDVHGTSSFTPGWTARAARALVAAIGPRATPVIHVELSDFGGGAPVVPDVAEAVRHALSVCRDVDVYDFHQARARRAFDELAVALRA